MLRLGAVGAARDGAGAGRHSGQLQSVPRSLRGRTMAAMVIRLMAMAMGPVTAIRVTVMAMGVAATATRATDIAPATATRLTAMAAATAIQLMATAMAPVTAIRLTAMAMAGALSAAVSMAPLIVIGAKAD